jgi:hypothetical protein
MATTTSAKAARKAAREATLEANAELARRTKLNIEDLATFFGAMSRADMVDEWLDEKISALRGQAAARRDEQRRQAGAALRQMRGRGEQVRDIARLARIGEKQVRELIRLAEGVPVPVTGTAEGPSGAVAVGGEAVSPSGDGGSYGAVALRADSAGRGVAGYVPVGG